MMPSTIEARLATDLDILRELNRHYIRSVAASDVGWFRDNLSSDFLNSNPDGSLVDREGFLAQIAKPTVISDLQCEDVRIRMIGDVGIVHARTTYRKPDGQRGAGRYTDIWARQNEHWVCVAAHVTRG